MMMRRLSVGLLLVLVANLLVAAPAAGQDGVGNGVIVEINPSGESGIGPLNPLLCTNADCQRVVDWLFPALFATDPANGAVIGGSVDNDGLVTQPQIDAKAGEEQIFTLRDLTWSDGTPVTAYDVFYSYLALVSETVNSPQRAQLRRLITGARVIDKQTIAFVYAAPDCATTSRTNFRIAPAHVFDPDFASFVDWGNAQTVGVQPAKTWLDVYPDQKFRVLFNHEFNTNPSATAGLFQLAAVRPMEDIRLSARSGALAFVYRDLPPGMDDVQYFLSGKSSLLINPPYERRADLRATPDIQISEYPGTEWDYIAFNLANPDKPKSAFDDRGQLNDQGYHPLFGDVRVRQAIQLGIDVPEIIDAAYLGNATRLSANLPPTSWAFNRDLKPVAYDPVGAQRLLEAAGWKDVDGDGIRECHGCQYAKDSTPLAFNLLVAGGSQRDIAAEFIRRQLLRIGVTVNVSAGSGQSVAAAQQFDAYLGGWTTDDPDQTALFTRTGDVLNTGSNMSSYYNEQVEALMAQARSVSGCDRAARTDLYRQIQTILQADQPYVWLYATNEMVVAQGGVRGFAPYPNDPLWNVRDWVVIK